MIEFLKSRAALIGALFGLFGGVLSKLLVINEMSSYYSALASLLSLIISLMVSFLLKGKWNRALRNKLKLISLALFTGFIASIYLHTMNFKGSTFPFTDFQGNTQYYIKGDVYKPAALEFRKENVQIDSDGDMIREGFGSPDEKDKAWTQKSIDDNELKLVFSYSLVILFFVSLVSVLIEVLVGHYHKFTLKTQ